jgi:tetratricopeptide (TPR) repeat protein
MEPDTSRWASPGYEGLQPEQPPGAGPADRPQHELSLFLQLELFHSLGAYGRAAQGLRSLNERMDQRINQPEAVMAWRSLFPSDAVRRMAIYNEELRTDLHLPAGGGSPSPLIGASSSQHPNPGGGLGGNETREKWMFDFYESAIIALEFATKKQNERKPTKAEEEFGNALEIVHDPLRRGGHPDRERELARIRIERNRQRLAHAEHLFASQRRDNRCEEIIGDHLESQQGEASLHTQVIGALVEAHIRMHRAEHLLSHSFGDKMRRRANIDEMVHNELHCSVALNTFAYVASRTVQWIFAARDSERAALLEDYHGGCETLTPTYCIWLAKQVSLLALERRAFTWLLLDEGERAYNDFQKVKRFARDLEQQFEERMMVPAGLHLFLGGLCASADHHSGRIYRVQHAYPAALRYFDRAAWRLRQLEQGRDAQGIMRNSRWRIQVLINQGKAAYELGQIKQALLCFIRAWRAFLELAETESSARANHQAIDRMIDWLERVEPDAEVNKKVLVDRIEPLVLQLAVVRNPTHLRILAADILLRLAHVLFTLKLPPPDAVSVQKDPTPVRAALSDEPTVDSAGGDNDEGPFADHRLAFRCLRLAAWLDPSRTLTAADLLKLKRTDHGLVPTDSELGVGIEKQWPGGGGPFEEAARVVEYALHRWLDACTRAPHGDAEATPELKVARDLLNSFLAHTESTNVKLAHVYRNLMRESRRETTGVQLPALDLVCLRRYSSFYPFVPRPMAFRAKGGGYFVRAHVPTASWASQGEPFGIALDPGPDFIDNLYRCGYCLADIHMIVVTHDHVDHMVTLDPMLALLNQRHELSAQTFGPNQRLMIVGNPSVAERYSFYNKSKLVGVFTFEAWERRQEGVCGEGESPLEVFRMPPSSVRIERVATQAHADSAGRSAQGVLISAGDSDKRPSILFTSDTGPFDDESRQRRRTSTPGVVSDGMAIELAIERAQVVVVHVSAIPLPQLRTLGGLSKTPADCRDLTKEFDSLWESLHKQVMEYEESDSPFKKAWADRYRFIMSQLQFGFHSVPPRRTREESQLSGIDLSPLSPCEKLERPSLTHLYLDGLLWFAEAIKDPQMGRLLLIGELHEELGTFRTRIARALNTFYFKGSASHALTTDIGLAVRVEGPDAETKILCSTCALDNDLVSLERFHPPSQIREVCVKGEEEGVFYNCEMHDPQRQPEPKWVERVERYDPLGH